MEDHNLRLSKTQVPLDNQMSLRKLKVIPFSSNQSKKRRNPVKSPQNLEAAMNRKPKLK